MSNPEKAPDDQLIKMLEDVPFFKKFTTYEKKRIAGHDSSFEKYPAGKTIIKDGTHDTAFFILIKGEVSVEKKKAPIAALAAGEFFGEMAFLTNAKRNTDIIAQSPCVVIKVNHDLLERLSAEIREKIKDQIIEKLVERLNKTTERLRVRM
ncbi:MAG: cyclic nucleotide-binding domain-containing protein [Magnetococcales bacterium]|nr:cyclic nucleotide-binding domain-containing protein [Magnetococcales bacterium]